MIRTFGDTGTEDLFYRRDTKAARKTCPNEAWKAAQRKLDYLNTAKTISANDSSDRVEIDAADVTWTALGPMEGWCSLRINDRYRVLFRWVNDAAEDVKVVDYH